MPRFRVEPLLRATAPLRTKEYPNQEKYTTLQWCTFLGGTSGIVLEPPLATIKALYNAEKLPDFTIPPEPKIPETKKEAQQGQKMQYLF